MNPFDEDEDAWPDEPDEFDPDSLGPEAPDPTPTLEESIEAAADAPDELVHAFWASVLLLNVAVAAIAVGAMVIFFRGDYGTGAPVVFVGVVAMLAIARYYWGVKTGRYSDEATGSNCDPVEDGSR